MPQKPTAWPGDKAILSSTTPPRSSVTTTPPNVALPELLTVPVKKVSSPCIGGLNGQSRVTLIFGDVLRGQAALDVAVTFVTPHLSYPRAVNVSTHGPQQS